MSTILFYNYRMIDRPFNSLKKYSLSKLIYEKLELQEDNLSFDNLIYNFK